MADENVNDETTGASADAEAPSEANNEVAEAPQATEVEAGAVEKAVEAAEEPVETLVPDAAGASAEAEATGDEPVEPAAEAATDEPSLGASATAEAPAQQEPQKKKKRLPRALRRQRPTAKREKPKQRKPITRLPKPESERGRRQERQGTVVSDAMDKTIVVKVDVIKAHARYKKVVRRSTKFHAHDERNEAKAGDVVRIVETRPISKQKRWRLAEIVEAAK
jgi:small subunit ribosomal protein S17